MTKKVLIIALIAVFSVAFIVYLFSMARTKNTNFKENLTNNETPPPAIDEKALLGKFLIVPNNYQFSAKEELIIKSSSLEKLLVEDATTEFVQHVSQQFQSLIVVPLGSDSEYTLCQVVLMADDSATATIEPGGYTGGQIQLCRLGKKVLTLTRLDCSISASSCQRDILIAISSHEPDYLYVPTAPLVALIDLPKIVVDQPLGLPVFTWKADSLEQFQSSYSIEILDSNGLRMFASGIKKAANLGDFYIPTLRVADQLLTVKLRIWLVYDAAGFTTPYETSTTFSLSSDTTAVVSPPPASNTKALAQMSWVPDWGMNSGIASIKSNPTKWHTISPVWFTPNKNGTLNKESTYNSAKLTSLLKTNNITLMPTISLFDADILSEILNKNLDKHVAEIVAIVTKNDYAGIDLDYESTYEADSALLVTFITKLAAQLHAQNKMLSFTALPKIDDRKIYSFLPQTHQAQDWQAIGTVVDEFRIMAYDFTGQGSKEPGPLSPLLWNEALIRYALTKMPAEKVVLALPLYSHAWPKPKTTNLAGPNNDQSLDSGTLKNTVSLQHDDIAYIKGHSQNYKESYDSWNKEVRATYTYNKTERVMFYLDKRAINDRLDLAEKYGIKGVCYWRIGGEFLD